MRRVFAEARRVVAEWKGRIVQVYMPSRLRYMGYDREARRLEETRRFLYRIAADAVPAYLRQDTVLSQAAAR